MSTAATPHPPSRSAEGGIETPVARLAGVSVRRGGTTVWRDASFGVLPGGFTAVVGPNGSGKTTLLKLLLGLLPAAAGRVEVLGRPPQRGNPAIGYVPQRRSLDAALRIRGRDLVALGYDGHRWGMRLPLPGERRVLTAAVDQVLSDVGATGYASRAIGELSGGEQQRLLLAQALIGGPRLLLLDEPLASLDVRNQAAIVRLVAAVIHQRGIAALMVTHDVNPVLGFVDQVAYVARGLVVAGPPAEIVTTETLSRVYDAPIDVLRDSRGRVIVVGLEEEVAHPHGH
jgi:zinc/manganese transport system ATP-binding protein